MIDLYYWTTPNGHKITIFLEEAGLAYQIFPVNIGKGEQFKAQFLAISPNNRIPAIIDQQPAGGGKPISVFETGAILLYLADKTGKFIAKDLRGRTATIEWLFWQMGGLGPMAGQYNHFGNYAVEKLTYAIDRYRNEVNRLYGVMNKRLADRAFLAGDYSMLPVGGSLAAPGAEHRRLPAPQALAGNDRRARRCQARLCQGEGGQPEPWRYQHRRAACHPVRPDCAVDRAHGVRARGAAAIGQAPARSRLRLSAAIGNA
jgi:glutathione S-transferase